MTTGQWCFWRQAKRVHYLDRTEPDPSYPRIGNQVAACGYSGVVASPVAVPESEYFKRCPRCAKELKKRLDMEGMPGAGNA